MTISHLLQVRQSVAKSIVQRLWTGQIEPSQKLVLAKILINQDIKRVSVFDTVTQAQSKPDCLVLRFSIKNLPETRDGSQLRRSTRLSR